MYFYVIQQDQTIFVQGECQPLRQRACPCRSWIRSRVLAGNKFTVLSIRNIWNFTIIRIHSPSFNFFQISWKIKQLKGYSFSVLYICILFCLYKAVYALQTYFPKYILQTFKTSKHFLLYSKRLKSKLVLVLNVQLMPVP